MIRGSSFINHSIYGEEHMTYDLFLIKIEVKLTFKREDLPNCPKVYIMIRTMLKWN